MFNFEKLETWQKAINFADLVYLRTRSFPGAERFDFDRPYAATEKQGNRLSGLRRSVLESV